MTGLDEALPRLHRKGSSAFPIGKGWLVALNVHSWALTRGYLTGAVYSRPRSSGPSYRLLVVGRCPFVRGRLRYYTVSLPNFNPEPFTAKEK